MTEQPMSSSLVAQMVKHLSTMWETWVLSLGWEDLLEKEMATHSSSLAWEITWTEEPGRLQSMGSQSWTFARKVIPNLDSLLKSKDISLPAKVCIVKAMVFPVVMYGCESWTIKKAECQRIDAFELWCWSRLLEVLLIARRLKEINPEYSLEGLMLKLKLQHFGYLMRKADSLEKTLTLGKTEGR